MLILITSWNGLTRLWQLKINKIEQMAGINRKVPGWRALFDSFLPNKRDLFNPGTIPLLGDSAHSVEIVSALILSRLMEQNRWTSAREHMPIPSGTPSSLSIWQPLRVVMMMMAKFETSFSPMDIIHHDSCAIFASNLCWTKNIKFLGFWIPHWIWQWILHTSLDSKSSKWPWASQVCALPHGRRLSVL